MTLISRKYIDDNDVVARYLADRLSAAERDGFEDYFLEHPEMLRELNTAAQFKSGLMYLRESGALDLGLQGLPWWKRANTVAIAASFVLIMTISGIWANLHTEQPPILAASAPGLTSAIRSTLPIVGSYKIQRTRTSFYDATIKLPINAAAIELRIKPEVPAVSTRYRVRLGVVTHDDSITHLVQVRSLSLEKDGFVSVYLNAHILKPAVYELEVSGDMDTLSANAASSFLIELTASNGN